MSDEVSEFLARGRETAAAQAATEPQVEAAVETPEAEQVETPTTEPAAERQPRDGVVPRQALDAERAERRDWKEKATRAETERDAERREREAERKAFQDRIAALEARSVPAPAPQPAPQQAAPVALPNPSEDPEGYASALRAQARQEYEVERLNEQERELREANPGLAVDLAYRAFVQANQEQGGKLFESIKAKSNRWAAMWSWALENSPQVKMLSEVGSDPDAWRSAERERIRAELASVADTTVPAQRQAPQTPSTPSLANTRSAGPRDAGAYTGPKSLGQIIGR